jgi:hypothetical protein
MSTPPSTAPTDWFDVLGRNRQPISVGLMLTGAAACVLAIVLNPTVKDDANPEVFTLLALGCALVGGGLYQYLRREDELPIHESGQLLVLGVGAVLGLALTVDCLQRAWIWRETLLGGMEAWRGKDGWRVWFLILGSALGFVIMFVSLLLARSREQQSPSLRRLLYGFNAFLTCYLLLVILIVVNVLAYNFVPAVADYTDTKIYTLNPKSQNLLREMQKPVTVYAIVPSYESDFTKEYQNLEDNCRRVTDRISFHYVARDRNPSFLRELIDKYRIVNDLGLLVIYGDEDSPGVSSQFIKQSDLFATKMGPGDSVDFKGEDQLMSAIRFLDENKTKPVIYFTQANGELDIGFAPQAMDENRKASVLRERLEKANYEVKGLKLSNIKEEGGAGAGAVTSAEVPDDAAVVLIAGPTRRFSEEQVKALETYMKRTGAKKGRLIVLLDVDVQKPEGVMRETGLESFLQSFDVDVGKDRILAPNDQPPYMVLVTGNPELRDSNPVAAALAGIGPPMLNVRTMRPHAGMPARPGLTSYRPETLMIAVPARGNLLWADTDLGRDPADLVEEIRNDANKRNSKQWASALPAAVAVSEAGMPDPRDPHAGIMPPKAGTPRLIAFGNAAFLSDANMRRGIRGGTPGYPYYDILESSLAWLRERPQSIGLDPKDRKIYQMDEATQISRMILLPLVMMVVAVIGLGLGVWVVRRR